jgi:hypothetical protein
VTRKCTRCGKTKDTREFYSWTDKKYGVVRYQSYCKSCQKIYQKERQGGVTVGKHVPVSLDVPVVTRETRARDVQWFEEKKRERQTAQQSEKI